jgi:hypothetical protein
MLQMVSHPERSYPNSDPGAAPTQNLGFRRWYHQWVHPGTGHTAHLWCICRHRTPNTASGWRRSITMEPRYGTPSLQPGGSKKSRNASTVRENNYS